MTKCLNVNGGPREDGITIYAQLHPHLSGARSQGKVPTLFWCPCEAGTHCTYSLLCHCGACQSKASTEFWPQHSQTTWLNSCHVKIVVFSERKTMNKPPCEVTLKTHSLGTPRSE